MSKRRQNKSGSKKKRTKRRRGATQGGELQGATGTMGGLVRGFRRAVGVEESRRTGPIATTIALAVVALLAGLVAWQLGYIGS